jgi:hypothetical protein
MTTTGLPRVAILLALGCLLSSCTTQPPTGSTTAAAAATGPETFEELNGSFGAVFNRINGGPAGAFGPLATVDGRVLTLSRGSGSWYHTFDAKLFEQYALLRHVPLTVFQLASSPGGNKQAAASYAARVRAALDALDTSAIPAAQLPDQRAVLQLSIELLDRVAAGTETSAADVEAFVQRTRPALTRNLDAEIAATIAALAVGVEQMRALMRPGEWERVYIAVEGDSSPQLAWARYEYLARVMGQDAKGKRLFVFPYSYNRQGGTFLRSRMLEDDLARTFFQRPYAGRTL